MTETITEFVRHVKYDSWLLPFDRANGLTSQSDTVGGSIYFTTTSMMRTGRLTSLNRMSKIQNCIPRQH